MTIQMPQTKFQTWELKDEVIFLNDENGILAAFPLHKLDESSRIRVMLRFMDRTGGESEGQ